MAVLASPRAAPKVLHAHEPSRGFARPGGPLHANPADGPADGRPVDGAAAPAGRVTLDSSAGPQTTRRGGYSPGLDGTLVHARLGGSRSTSDDCQALHETIAAHLRAIIELTAAGGDRADQLDTIERANAMAIECTVVLNRLYVALALQRDNRRKLEREHAEARAALQHSQAQFHDSQAGALNDRHLALHDDLTTLPNRRQCRHRLNEALDKARSRSTSASLLFMDLDDFKLINDRYGHQTGDEVLRIVAARLTNAVRSADVLCRLGGDEFVCLPGGSLDPSQLAHLAKKLFEAVGAPLILSNLCLRVRPSIGIATFPTHADDVDGLLKAADAAMYRAKQERSGFAFAGQRARPTQHSVPDLLGGHAPT